jgi:hypothetical protein
LKKVVSFATHARLNALTYFMSPPIAVTSNLMHAWMDKRMKIDPLNPRFKPLFSLH